MAPESGKTYVIVNSKSNTVMDLSGQDQRSIIGFTNHRSENQKWTFNNHPDGWTIQNRYNGKFLDVDLPGVVKDSERVVASDNQQKWNVEWDDQFQGFRIFVQGTRINADLSDHGNPTPGTPVVLWEKWGGQNQVWRLDEA